MRGLQRVQRAHLHEAGAPIPTGGGERRAGDGHDGGLLRQFLYGVQRGPRPPRYLLRRTRVAREQNGILVLPSPNQL